MGLSWQQGPLSEVSVGRFLTPEPLAMSVPFRPLFRQKSLRRGALLGISVALAGLYEGPTCALLDTAGRRARAPARCRAALPSLV